VYVRQLSWVQPSTTREEHFELNTLSPKPRTSADSLRVSGLNPKAFEGRGTFAWNA
jgi:hypothetical protein